MNSFPPLTDPSGSESSAFFIALQTKQDSNSLLRSLKNSRHSGLDPESRAWNTHYTVDPQVQDDDMLITQLFRAFYY